MSTSGRFKALLNGMLKFLRWLAGLNKPKAKHRIRGNGWLSINK